MKPQGTITFLRTRGGFGLEPVGGASCRLLMVGKNTEGFRVKRQNYCMNISLGSNLRPRNIWWSLQGAGPAQKAHTVKFGRQRGRKELGGR